MSEVRSAEYVCEGCRDAGRSFEVDCPECRKLKRKAGAAPDVKRPLAACDGAATGLVNDSPEEMEECLECGTRVRRDLVDHPFYGFKAGCMFRSASP